MSETAPGPMSRRGLLFLEIAFTIAALLLAWGIWSSNGLARALAALLVAGGSFGAGLLIILWLYGLARRRVTRDIKPKQWEYRLQALGPYVLPPSIAFGMWASHFGADTDWNYVVGVGCFALVAGIAHGLFFLEPPDLSAR